MATQQNRRRARLSIEVEPELRMRIERAAADHQQSVTLFIRMTLERALEQDATAVAEKNGWTSLSAHAFARDWESDEDRIYDDLPAG